MPCSPRPPVFPLGAEFKRGEAQERLREAHPRGPVSQKIKHRLSMDPAIPLLGLYPKELKSGTQMDICTPMFIAALFTVAKRWKQCKCPLTDTGINKMWSVHTMEYYSAIKGRKF